MNDAGMPKASVLHQSYRPWILCSDVSGLKVMHIMAIWARFQKHEPVSLCL